MGQRTLLRLGTPAVEDPVNAYFHVAAAIHADCKPILAIAGLQGDEELCLWFDTGYGFIPVEANSNDGQQVKFTPDYSADIINGAGTFGVTKTSTASEIAITIQDGRG